MAWKNFKSSLPYHTLKCHDYFVKEPHSLTYVWIITQAHIFYFLVYTRFQFKILGLVFDPTANMQTYTTPISSQKLWVLLRHLSELLKAGHLSLENALLFLFFLYSCFDLFIVFMFILLTVVSMCAWRIWISSSGQEPAVTRWRFPNLNSYCCSWNFTCPLGFQHFLVLTSLLWVFQSNREESLIWREGNLGFILYHIIKFYSIYFPS